MLVLGRSAGPKQWSAGPHRSDDAGNPGQGQDSDVLRQRQGGPGRHDDEMPNPCRVLRAGRRCGRFLGRRPTSTESQAAPGMPQGGSIRRAEARGDVTVVSKDQNASGDLGVYDMKKKTITLTGNVVVSQGKNVLHGERVVVDTVTGDARIDSGVAAHDGVGSGVTPRDRVRVLIVPGKDTKGAPTNTMSFEAPSHPH